MPATLERFDTVAREVWSDPEFLREKARLERETWAMWAGMLELPGYLGRRFAGELNCPMPFAPAGTLIGRRYLDADGDQCWPPEWEWPV